MKSMTAAEVRRAFVDFFAERGHTHHPSASLIPHDPTLLFTVAGMVPFKQYFTGELQPPFRRAVTIQKCVRAGGKHNDLDEIGRTSRHLTFFEMMGNFSFGDYFKPDACAWAWEFVTAVLGLDPERLWITVHLSDDEAEAIWRDGVGVPAERIQRLGEDNYWRMADVGPCGPCSEIFWDKGPEYGPGGGPAHGGEERYIEIWNLVFMQFESAPDGTEIPLPKPSIDTGMGLERTVAVLQGVDSVWETDEFVALLGAAERLTGTAPGTAETSDVSLRILADHARSTSLLVSDGVFPSNEDRGYVLRRILRRAVRHAYLLGVDEPVMGGMVDAVVDVMGDANPDLRRNHGYVRDVIDREEQRFRQTLRTGQAILDSRLSGLGPGETLDGDVAFLLHDTYGFPLEVTVEIAAGRDMTVDTDGFSAAMAAQQQRARSARSVAADGDVSVLSEVLSATGSTEFTGRAEDTAGNFLAVGEALFETCAGCHGANGEGGVGPTFATVLSTFSSCADHIEWVTLATGGFQEAGRATYGDLAKSVGGGGFMPGFATSNTPEEIASVVVFERIRFGGADPDETLIECGLIETEGGETEGGEAEEEATETGEAEDEGG